MTSGTWQNMANVSLTMGTNSLLIVPAGFDTSTGFASYSTLGFTCTAGSTLNVGPGTNLFVVLSSPLWLIVRVLSGGSIALNGGVQISGTGKINWGRATWS